MSMNSFMEQVKKVTEEDKKINELNGKIESLENELSKEYNKFKIKEGEAFRFLSEKLKDRFVMDLKKNGFDVDAEESGHIVAKHANIQIHINLNIASNSISLFRGGRNLIYLEIEYEYKSPRSTSGRRETIGGSSPYIEYEIKIENLNNAIKDVSADLESYNPDRVSARIQDRKTLLINKEYMGASAIFDAIMEVFTKVLK